MRRQNDQPLSLSGPRGSLPLRPDDEVAIKFAMLVEGECNALGPAQAASKYGYSRGRYYQLLNAYEEGGAAALLSRKSGPKSDYRRTPRVIQEVIRQRFLDPDASPAVIAQKVRQCGWRISARSVERIIAAYGLQKKDSSAPVAGC